jgi:hypothetical protein
MSTASGRKSPGDFDARTLVGNFDFDIAQLLDFAPRFGLHRDGQYLYGLVRADDGEPICLYRKIELNGYSWGLSIQTKDEVGQIRINREIAGQAYRGRLHRDLVGESVRFAPDSITAGKAAWKEGSIHQRGLTVEVTNDTVRWIEDGAFELTATPVGPGMQWYTPYDRGGILWLSVGYKCEGVFQGKPVRGFLFLDHAYLPEGLSYPYDPLVSGLEVRWNTFANWYEDGTVEVGHIACGHDQWGFALVNDSASGVLHATADIAVRITERDTAGHFPRRIETRIGSEGWLWTLEPGCDMIDFDRPDNPNSNGIERRANETRRIVVSMGWGETCPPNGDVAGTW